MSLTIQGNINSSIAHRSLMQAQNAMDRALAKLSSGKAIQSARDDAAGLAIASRIRGEIVSLQKYMQNAQQGTAMLQIAEGVYQRTEDMLVRMRSLASQAQGSNLSAVERGMLDTEYQQIKLEITRIARSTTFGGQALMDVVSAGFNFTSSGAAEKAGLSGTLAYEYIDVNGDGIVDMLGADNLSGKINVNYGNGDGTFQNVVMLSASSLSSVANIIKGDFNGDGVMDFVITDGASVQIFTNNGNGSFTGGSTINMGATTGFAVGDLDGDGRDDIAASKNTTLTIRYATGTSQTITMASLGNSLAIADLNNDGRMDLSVVDNANGTASSMINNGNNSYTEHITGSVAASTLLNERRQHLTDWDGDGDLDMIGTDGTFVYLMKNDGAGNWGSRISLTKAGTYTNIAVGDFDGDGVYDLATYDASSTSVGIWQAGSLAAPVYTISGFQMGQLAAVDLNRDGRLDLLGLDTSAGNAYNRLMNGTSMGLESTIRVGGNAAAFNNISFRMGSTRLNSLDQFMQSSVVNTIGSAKRAEASIKRAMETLGLFRTGVAASINRLEKVRDNLGNMVENLEAARSAIEDLDVAAEMSNFIAQKMVVDAGISMIAQANQRQQILLKLLQDNF